jgi:hypothetical protein
VTNKYTIEYRKKLSYPEFIEKYVSTNTPVIVTDAILSWKALARWTPEFFKKEFGSMKFMIQDHEKGQGEYKENGGTEYTMAQFIDRVLESDHQHPAPYFRNRILSNTFPALKQDIEPLPHYIFPNWLPESYLIKDVQQVFNRGAQFEIYIGGKGGSFPVLHYDGLASHAFLMQIYGQKRFIVYHPDQTEFMYPTPGQPHLSQIKDVECPDSRKFPMFAKAQPVTFVLQPGDLLFVPSRWWHTTKMLTPSITVSINVVNGSNWAALTDFVCSKRKPILRVPSRIYLNLAGSWRSLRDQRRQHGSHDSV